MKRKSNEKTTEMKALPVFVKEINGRTVTGYASVFGVLDSYDDIVHPGAFAKTIQEQAGRVKHLWQHDTWSPPIAVIKELREAGRDELPAEVLEKYPESTGGLLVVREYLNTERANEVFEGIKSGAITEMSFMYNTIRSDYEEREINGQNTYVRNLLELRLWETSDVNWGANEATVASKDGPLGARIGHLIQEAEGLKNLINKKSRGLDAARLKDAIEMLKTALDTEPDGQEPNHSDDVQTRKQAAELRFRHLNLQNRSK